MSAIDLVLKTRRWFMRNEDSGEVLEGQFPPQNTTKNIKNNYAQHTALNRSKTIIQYLNSQNDTVSFSGAFFARDVSSTGRVQTLMEKLESWARRDPELLRPPIVTFWIGDGHLEQRSVIDSISNITYGEPTITGAIREVTFQLNLLEYQEFSLDEDEVFETRYHRAKERDYYEILTWREYGLPLLGDVIRKQHPDQPNLQPADIVRLPSIEAVRTIPVEPTSVALTTAYGRKDTPQRALRIDMFNRRNRKFISHIVVE